MNVTRTDNQGFAFGKIVCDDIVFFKPGMVLKRFGRYEFMQSQYLRKGVRARLGVLELRVPGECKRSNTVDLNKPHHFHHQRTLYVRCQEVLVALHERTGGTDEYNSFADLIQTDVEIIFNKDTHEFRNSPGTWGTLWLEVNPVQERTDFGNLVYKTEGLFRLFGETPPKFLHTVLKMFDITPKHGLPKVLVRHSDASEIRVTIDEAILLLNSGMVERSHSGSTEKDVTLLPSAWLWTKVTDVVKAINSTINTGKVVEGYR